MASTTTGSSLLNAGIDLSGPLRRSMVNPGRVDNFLVMGKSGAGKQPRIDALRRIFGLTQLSTGTLFRTFLGAASKVGYKGDISAFYDESHGQFIPDEEILAKLGPLDGHDQSTVLLGMKAKYFVDKGLFVPDEVTNRIFEEYFSRFGYHGLILDGYPRTLEQAKFVVDLCERKGTRIDCVLVVDNDDTTILTRTVGRRICPKCGKVYHVISKPAIEGKFCAACGTEVIQRSDDHEDKIRARLHEFETKTMPAIKWLRSTPHVPVWSCPGNLPVFTDESVLASVKEALGLPSDTPAPHSL
ncbi:adenylate kinase, mitochondrial [Pelomyxa schiedti]|nr:adenylate kinase, mitochondrial [Pelomyxa schiedti]